jgi:hypothetical protein
MANLPLVAGIVTAIQNQPMVTVTKVSLRRTRAVAQRYGALGPIGSAAGPYKFQGTLTFAVPISGLEIDIDALSALPTGFSINFSKGARRYLVRGCFISEDGVDNNPETAETDNQVSIVATEMVPA